MRLDEYVKKSLLDITNAVSAARDEAKIWIAPGRFEGEVEKSAQLIEFEVSVTTNTEGGGSIDVLSVVKGETSHSHEQMNKIKFSVPVYFQAPKLK